MEEKIDLLEERLSKINPKYLSLLEVSYRAQKDDELIFNANNNGLSYFLQNIPENVRIEKIPKNAYLNVVAEIGYEKEIAFISDMCACGKCSNLTEKNISALAYGQIFHFIEDTGDINNKEKLIELLSKYNGKKVPIEKLQEFKGEFYNKIKKNFLKDIPEEYLDRLHIIPVMKNVE